MKYLVSTLAMVSLFTATPALASDVSSDRHFTESKALQARALESLKAPAAQGPAAPAKQARCACSCAMGGVDSEGTRAEPGGH
jgi:hypothetical protein